MNAPPPLPPPPPGSRGLGGPGPGNMRPPPPPGVGGRPPGPPGPQHFSLPMRNSTRFVDVTPRLPMSEEEAKKKLTTYEAHTIRKITPLDPKKEKSSWARSEITKESLNPEEVAKQVKKLNETRRTVSDKKQALQQFQQKQVNTLLDDLSAQERDQHFGYSLAQLDSKIKSLKNGQRETTVITVYVKRAPLKEVNPAAIWHALEKQKAERMATLTRPPVQPQAQQQLQQMGQPGPGAGAGAGIVEIKRGQGKDNDRSRIPKPRKRSSRRYHHGDDHSSMSSMFDSDTESSSGYSSQGTSIDSVSDRHRRHGNRNGRRRSHSRLPEHRRQYLIDDVVHSPDPRIRDSFGGGPIPTYVPEVPRGIPSIPPFDPVAAAYQAGKVDADAERFGLDRMPRVRPIAADRAVVSYGRLEPRFSPEPRYEPRIDPRYVDELDDLRFRDEEFRRREAEDYIDRRASEPRVDYHSRRTSEPRVIYANPNPFATRRYAPSYESF